MNRLKWLFVVFLSLILSSVSYSQNVAVTDDDTYTANSSAMLDVKSLTKGLLIPRMSTAQRTAIVSPATGLLVFDTSLSGFYYYNGTAWTNLTSGSASGIWSYNSPNIYLTNSTDRVGLGTTSPLHKLQIVDNVAITDGTDGSFIDIQNNNNTSGVMSGIRFWNGTTTNTFKGGIFYQDKLGWGVGDLIFANNTVQAAGNVSVTDAKLVIKNTGSVEVKGTATSNVSLFHVLNSAGDTIFAVYDGGVRINVYDDPTVKASGSKGGFAVGGFSPSKGTFTNEFLKVTPDSVRVYIEDGPTAKASGSKGGFAVGGFSPSKLGPTNDYLNISSERTKVFMTDPLQGFAVNNIETGEDNLMNLTKSNYFIGHQTGMNRTTGNYNSVVGFQAGMEINTGGYNSFFGYLTGNKTTSGSNNSFYGYKAGMNNLGGFSNSFYGHESGVSNTGGYDNSFFGFKSGYSNTLGNYNTFLGYQSGYSFVSGDNNTFVGYNSGAGAYGGNNNTFLGPYSGYFCEGNHNICIGYQAGYQTTGNYNSFFGYQAGFANSTGNYNLFMGYQTGKSNTSGADNLFVGYYSGNANTSGSSNSYFGVSAGQAGNGSNNTMIGKGAGAYATSGDGNTFLGAYAGYGSGTNGGNVFIGNQVGYTNVGANKLMIDNSDVNASTALIYGEFDTDKIKLNAKVSVRDFFILERETITVTSGATITPTKSYVKVSAASALTLSATTSIADEYTGQVLVIEGSSDTYTITILDNTNTRLAGNAACTLGNGDTIMLMHNGSEWVEISRSNN